MKAIEEYLLTTKLFCGHCLAMMTGISGTSKTGKSHHYYKCNQAKLKKCDKKAVRKESVENMVVQHCRSFLTDENIKKITQEVVKVFNEENDEAEIKRLNKLIKENERKQNNLVSAISECDLESARQAFYGQLTKLDSDKKQIEQQLASIKLSRDELTESEIKFFLIHLRNGIIQDEKYRKMLVNVLVQAIYLYDNKLTIIFNVNNQPVEFEVSLIEEIEVNNKEYESSFLASLAPYIKTTTSRLWFFSVLPILYFLRPVVLALILGLS
ncbi:zinc ribbon domain-containing protein [Paenibacillus alba]|uniref:Zinc ribbon domain-containing protein n=2 Tax=Paenibacillus alba TaxID=1197127 RepID=A0ABU6G3B2_9BACL|nr:zinc ribbon domain-containing protein [Paenibacillus alba]